MDGMGVDGCFMLACTANLLFFDHWRVRKRENGEVGERESGEEHVNTHRRLVAWRYLSRLWHGQVASQLEKERN